MSTDTQNRLARWLTPEVIVAVVTLGLGGVAIYTRVTSAIEVIGTKMQQMEDSRKDESQRSEDSRRILELRVTGLEQGRAADREGWVELRADVKYIKQQVDRPQVKP